MKPFPARFLKVLSCTKTLTEYFRFANPQTVERDLNKMQAKVLSPVEQNIVDGKQDDFLVAVLADGQSETGNKQIEDRLKFQLQQNFLSKHSSQQVIAALHQGYSLRDAAATASVSVEVARRVLAVMQT